MERKSISCNVAICPSDAVIRRAAQVSRILKRSGGLFTLGRKTYYPHITLYMSEFPVKNLRVIETVLEEIASMTRPFRLTAINYRTHEGSIDVRFKRNRTVAELHKRIVHRLNPLREGLLRRKDLVRFRQFNQQKQKNLRTWGYDNVFSQFSPHLTFTKLRQGNRSILSPLPRFNFSFLAKEFALFQSAEHGTCKKLIARFKLS